MNLLCEPGEDEPGEDEVSIKGKLNNQRPSPTMPFLWENPFFFSWLLFHPVHSEAPISLFTYFHSSSATLPMFG